MLPRPNTLRQWVIVVFGALGIGLLPWTIWLSSNLRPHHVTESWDIAWSGFDSGLALLFVLTAIAAYRRSPWVGALSAATGTMLLTDAWFDVVLESHADELYRSLLLAILVELPLAVFCFWIAHRTEQFLARVVQAAYGDGRASHLSATGKGASESDFVGVLEVTADGEPAREPRDPDASA
ncbi:MAG: hypothetical protein H0X39_14630 [Actinobacteria bacterium]|nr:hypothetical protein [Actinomycetota bacterium]